MTAAYDASPELTAEQTSVVGQPVDAKVLLTAGAGTGKTYTLVRRLDSLVAREGIAAGEVLVLTFSRSAVREISTRLAAHGNSARRMRARTFDSWALDLLEGFDAATGWRSRSFEGRIIAATDLIGRGGADELYEDGLVHVVIDEAQDLVGARRELVETLLDRYDCGFTVVGDIAQSIYGWQAVPDDRKGEAGRFVRWLRVTFGGELIELELSRNFRARTVEASTALAAGSRLRDLTAESAAETAFADVMALLRGDLLDRLDFGDFSAGYVQDALRDFDGSTAILCRTNGQALLVSDQLHSGEVPHRVQASARDRVIPAWFAGLFPAGAASTLSRDEFDEAWQAEKSDGRPDAAAWAEAVWRQLLGTAGAFSGRALDRARLRAAIGNGRMPDELTDPGRAALTVSSVHRAKGLEFDRVIVVTPPAARKPDDDIAEETRTLYVAMTRARDDLMRVDAPDTRTVRLAEFVDRWGRYGWKKYQRFGMELRGGDVDVSTPPGTLGFHTDPVTLQQYIRENVSVSDELVLERNDDILTPDAEPPMYVVFHDGWPIGIASDGLRTALDLYMKQWRTFNVGSWPRMITNVWVDSVETVAGGEAAGQLAGLGAYGVWLVPRLGGLSRFTYDEKGVDHAEP